MQWILLAFLCLAGACAATPINPQTAQIERGARVYARYMADEPFPAGTPREVNAFTAYFDADFAALRVYLDRLPPTTIGDELHRRVILEQFVMQTLILYMPKDLSPADSAKFFAAVAPKQAPLIAANTARLKTLLSTRDWFDDAKDGAGAEHWGWLIVQHSDADLDFQRDILKRIEALKGTRAIKMADYALLYDRVALADKRPQRYASQVLCKDGKMAPVGDVEDPPRLDQRRAEVGLRPWADYITGFAGFRCP